MNMLDHRLGAWSGLVFTVMFGVGLALAGWLPLPTPNMTVDEVVHMYQSRTNWIRLGMIIMVTGSVFFLAMTVVTTLQMRRMQAGAAAAYLQLAAGIVNMTTFFFGPLIMGVATFRPDRNPEVIYALHDLGWLIFIMPFPPATVQCLSIALGIFMDGGKTNVFPRWFAFMCLWSGLLYLPGGLVFFFKTGPFAWNGILAFYIAATAFFAWIVTLVTLLLKAIKSQESGARSLEKSAWVGDGGRATMPAHPFE